jgi:two-component system, OmpR family, phosphate regulon sensor histidine kinase PhoR
MATTGPRGTRRLEDPELVGSLLSAVRQLRQTEEELERRNAELIAVSNALEAERRRYEQQFHRALFPQFRTAADGLIIEANVAAAEMFRVDPRFLPGKPIAAFVARDDRRRFRAWLLHPEVELQPVFRMERRGGVSFDAEVRVFDDGEALGWIIRDVTEARLAEERLWELNRELERRVAEQAGEIATVYEQLPVGVAIVHADSRDDPQINPRGRQLVGETFPFDSHAERALKGEDVRLEVVRLAPPRRSEVVFQITASPLRDRDGTVTGAVVIFADVTDREAIERADREFVTNASHQLRTPITAIAGAVAALKAGAGADPAARQRFLDHLETEADRLTRIIDAMLVLSKAQRHELDAPLTLVRVRPMLERLLAETTPADGVALSCDCEDTVAVIAHAAVLEEAIASALANAIEHTTKGSVSLTAVPSGDRVVIEVADTGPGMAPEVRDRAFERFYGANTSRRSAGLGLAIAAAAVRVCRGAIELDSAPGAGTRLRIILPGAVLRA